MHQFETFCANYRKCFKYRQNENRRVGVEKEILVTDEAGFMADLPEKVWPHFRGMGLKEMKDIFYKDETVGFFVGKDQITTDAGRGTFEVILEPYKSIQDVEKRMKEVLAVVFQACEREKLKVLGFAFQPRTRPSKFHWNRKQRYEILLKVFKNKIYQSALSASDQAHIDVSAQEAIAVVNMMNGLAGFMMFLFDNSPVRFGKLNSLRNYRELIWDTLGRNRTGIPVHPFASMEDYLKKMWDLKCVMARKGDKFFNPGRAFRDYVKRMTDEDVMKAFEIHEGTIWFCARPRMFGTVEVRPAGVQPWADMVSVAAFSLGIIQNRQETEAFIHEFRWNDLRLLRYRAGSQGMRHNINGATIAKHLKKILEIAQRGLEQRGKGEEVYLEALFARVRAQESPAERMAKHFTRRGLPFILKHLALKKKHVTPKK